MAVLLMALAIFFAGLLYSARQVIAEMPRVTGALENLLPLGIQNIEVDQMMNGGEGAAQDANGDSVPGAEQGGSTEPLGAQGGPSGDSAPRPFMPGTLSDIVNQAGSTAASWLVEAASGLARRIVGAVGTFVGTTVIVFFMVLLALGEGPQWRSKLGSLWPGGSEAWQHALDTVSRKLRSFLLVRAAMGALSAALYVALLWLFGIDLLLVWAVITFLLGFVPNLGSVISGVLPALYALVTKDFQVALIVAVGLFAIEQVIGNFLDPRLQGRQIAVSPVVVLIAILVWGWIWGVAGALLAVPVTVAILVAFAHVSALRPIALLLSNQSDQEELMRSMEW